MIVPTGADVTWKSPRHLRSNVIVETGAKLTIRCDVGMPEGARITVQPGGHLVVDGARIYPNCDGKLWEGIVVQGSGNGFTQSYDPFAMQYYHGRCTINPGSVIEKANVGVRAQEPYFNYPGGPDLSGGIVKATRALFYNCGYYAVSIRDFQNTTIFGQNTGNLCSFRQCTFLVDGDYGGSLSSLGGMARLRYVDGVTFTGCQMLNEYPQVQSNSNARRYGIRAFEAGFRYNGFCADSPQYPGGCQDYQNARISGFYKGIHATNKRSMRTFRVTGTDFTDNHMGIFASAVPNAYIVDNNFEAYATLPPYPFSDPLLKASHVGVSLVGCTGYKVEENKFKGYKLAPTEYLVGILAKDSGPEDNEIYRNDFEELYAGNVSNGLNKSTNPLSPLDGLRYRCNDNGQASGTSDDNSFDFFVKSSGAGGGIASEQGSAQQAAGNTFSEPAAVSSGSEKHFKNEDAALTYFYTLGQLNQEPINYSESSISIDEGEQNFCPSNLPTDKEKGVLSSTEKDLYAQQHFTSSDPKVRARAANELIRHYMVDSTDHHRDSIIVWLERKGGLRSGFSIADLWLQEGNLEAVKQKLNGLADYPAGSDHEKKERDLFIELKLLQMSALEDGLNDIKLVEKYGGDLNKIADEKPFFAAYQARNLLNDVLGTDDDEGVLLPDPETAPDSGDGTGNNNNTSGDFTGKGNLQAVPNPAQGQTLFQFEIFEEVYQNLSEAYLVVKTASGNTVLETPLLQKSGTVQWDFGQTGEMVYFYGIRLDGQTFMVDKLIVF